MRLSQNVASIIVSVLIVTGCGEKSQQPPAEETPPAKLFQFEREALDKAKGVDQVVEQQAEDLRHQAEQQEK